MVDVVKFFRDEGRVIQAAPWSFISALAVGAAVSFGISEYHYSGRIDGLNETIEGLKTTLETKDHPAPVTRTIEVPVPNPSKDREIAALERTNENLSAALRAKPTGSSRPAKPQASSTSSFSNQSGGVAQGNNSQIGTVNQNGLPARSIFAGSLGKLYTEGYLLEQQIGMKGLTDAQFNDLNQQAAAWINKVIGFMNGNMCSDAAAYFLKFHGPSISYGLPDKQDHLFDALASYLDNLSDEKRNDAWDCK